MAAEAEMFRDRIDAGRQLADTLAERDYPRPVVLALPRGGVPVAAEIATRLKAPLDLLLVRKIGTPWQPELAAGAVLDGAEPEVVWNEHVLRGLRLGPEDFKEAIARELATIERRRADYLGDRAPVPLDGVTAIVVDDGIATGATMRAALRGLAKRGPAKVVLAVPVAPPESLAELRALTDETICLQSPRGFGAVGEFYASFPQVSDAEVKALLARPG
jgi:putative phosphoribosyl transferase